MRHMSLVIQGNNGCVIVDAVGQVDKIHLLLLPSLKNQSVQFTSIFVSYCYNMLRVNI